MAQPCADRPYDKDVWDMYEAGKGRRYGLLFSANGGAFAIAALLADFSHSVAGLAIDAFGLIVVAAFMIVFNVMMWQDIHAFGLRLRGFDQQVRGVGPADPSLLFGAVGETVLFAFCGGLALAWACVLLAGVVVAAVGLDPPAQAGG